MLHKYPHRATLPQKAAAHPHPATVIQKKAKPADVRAPRPPHAATAARKEWVAQLADDSARRRYEGEKKATNLENEELNTYVDLRERGFSEKQLEVAGAGGANADFFASDGERMWVVEVKGRNKWMSADNLSLNGNVPGKQLGNKVVGKKAQTLKGVVLGSEASKKVDLSTYVCDSEDGYASLLLRVTQLDIDDALLTFTVKVDGEGKATITGFETLSLHAALTFILADDDEKSAGRLLKASWEEFPGDARSWLIQSPKDATDLSNSYTAARRTAAHQVAASVSRAKLTDDDIELRLVPVTKNLPPLPKPE
jgi:hypothetical protein